MYSALKLCFICPKLSARMCLHVIFTSPVAYPGQLSALTSVDASITSEKRWLDVTFPNPSRLLPPCLITHTHTHKHTRACTNTHSSYSLLSILLQLCKLVQASESLLLFAMVLPWFRGHVACKLSVLEFFQPLHYMKIKGHVKGGGRKKKHAESRE